MLVRKLAASLLSLCLVASMCPAVAFASQLEAGSVASKPPATVSTQSAKKQYVITSIGTDLKDKHHRNDYTYYENGLIKSKTTYTPLYITRDDVKWNKSVAKYKYNKKGLLTKITVKSSGIKGHEPKTTSTYTYKYNSKGKPASCTFKQNKNKWSAKYSYDSRGVLSLVEKADGTYTYNGKKATRLIYTTFDKKGQLVGERQVYAIKKNGKWNELDIPGNTSWKYDSKGYVTQEKSKQWSSHTTNYKNTYKKGRLTKVSYKDSYGTKGSFGIKYKKSAVSSKFSKIVKQQQLDLINPTEYYI